MHRLLRLVETGIEWLHAKLDKKQFLILSSMLVGLTAGLAAVILKLLVHFIRGLITHDYHIAHQYIFYLLFPVIGIALSVLFVKKVLGGKLGRGTSNILYAIAKKGSRLPPDQMYSHIVTSALTVGFGGSAGLESPIVTTGSAIGSNYGRTYKLTYKDRTLLLACGAAAGIAASFNAPIAGLLFALEVLLADVTISAFIPIMIAAAAGGLISKVVLNEDMLLSFKLKQAFDYHNVPWYIVLGLLAGLVSVYYTRVFPKVESFFRKRKKHAWTNVIVGGSLLAVLIWLFPSLFGEGYDSIKTLADSHPGDLMTNSPFSVYSTNTLFILVFFFVIIFVKAIAAGLTIGSGGNGGNFAPSLFVGGYLGFVFAYGLNLAGFQLPAANFTIVAMAGVLSGIFHAPLTGMFLIAEITGGYELMIPLMIVSALSYSVVKYFEPYSMDTKRLAKKGEIFTHNRDRNVLSTMSVRKILETDFQAVNAGMTLGELVDTIASSKRNIFPVVDKEGRLSGVIQLDHIREVMFKSEKYNLVTVKQLMLPPPAFILPDEEMYSVMRKFDDTQAWNLPVIDNGIYLGFISKSGIFSRYREKLMTNIIDHEG